MAKRIALMSVIVLATIQCLIDGKSVMFVPSKEPQDIPKPDAEEAVERGLAKPAPAAKSSKPKGQTKAAQVAVEDPPVSDDQEAGQVNI